MSTATSDRFVIEAYDGPTASEAVLRDVFTLWQAEDAELRPDDPPFTFDHIEGLSRVANPHEVRIRWLARERSTGGPIGRAEARLPMVSNLELAYVDLYVHPDARRAGVGTSLTRTVLDAIEVHGRTRIRTDIYEGTPGEAFLRGRGGTIGLTYRKSRMDLGRLDRHLMRSWIARAEQTAAAYSLLWFTRPPEDRIEQYIAVRRMMNAAPRGELEDGDRDHTPASIIAEADELEAEHLVRWSLVARHDATGDFVGFTEVVFAESAPEHAWQGGTAVHPDHRNHGLGSWLKASMVERILDERPQVRFVDTENAYTNEPMLHINAAMGFELMETLNDWQAPVAAVRAALEGRS